MLPRSQTACVHRITRRQVRSCFQGRGRAHTRKLFILRPCNLGSEAPAQEGVSAQVLRVTLKRRFEAIISDTALKPTSKHRQYLMLCTELCLALLLSSVSRQLCATQGVHNHQSATKCPKQAETQVQVQTQRAPRQYVRGKGGVLKRSCVLGSCTPVSIHGHSRKSHLHARTTSQGAYILGIFTVPSDARRSLDQRTFCSRSHTQGQHMCSYSTSANVKQMLNSTTILKHDCKALVPQFVPVGWPNVAPRLDSMCISMHHAVLGLATQDTVLVAHIIGRSLLVLGVVSARAGLL